SNVAAKQKFSTESLPAGAAIKMYGVLVGKASQPIERGELLSTGNLHHQAAEDHEKTHAYSWERAGVFRGQKRRFGGYRRSDGQVGTRNYWIVVPLVFCENRNILNLKQAFEEELGFSQPHSYRRQVAELVKLYREGKPPQIHAAAPEPDGDTSSTRP